MEVELDKNMKILIVYDFSTMRRIIKNLLRDLGFTNTVEADDGLTAIPILNSGSIDFLVTDWNMPGMTGIDLLRHVRADEKLRSLPVLMVTAEAKREQIIEAAQAGVNGYVVKPFTALALKEKIEKISIDGRLREKLGGKPLLLTDRQLKIIEFIQQVGFLQNQAFATLFPMISEDTILNELKGLLIAGIIKKQGKTKGAKYVMS